jgi:hypothetical protein
MIRAPKTFVVLGASAAFGGPAAVALADDQPAPPPETTTEPSTDTPALLAPPQLAHAVMREHARRLLVHRYRHMAKRAHRHPARGHRNWGEAHLRRQIRALHRQARIEALRPTGVLARIAQCESHFNPRAVSASGTFRGMYQFSFSTWRAVGGKGDPADASVGEQTMRARILYRRAGSSPWPVCGR